MSDREALLAAVCEFPDDDTPRLVYADWLDENTACECCCGTGRNGWKVWDDDHGPCAHCAATGKNGNEARAELIRVQCELARVPQFNGCHCRGRGYLRRTDIPGVFNDEPGNTIPCPYCPLRARAGELLTDERRREWAPVTCPACDKGLRETPGGFFRNCDHCGGTGFAQLTWERGFPVAVRCRMRDVLREKADTCPNCFGYALANGCKRCLSQGIVHKWTVTPWAEGVARSYPVTRWEIVDRGPAVVTVQGGRFYGWNSGDGDNVEPYRIPRCVMDEFPGTAWFATEAEARDALALAVGRAVRRELRLSTTDLR
jgi:uncharacterized protein (TIGR02996 family)